MEGDSGIVMEDVCGDDMRDLGERLVLMLMRAGILVGGVVVVVVVGVMAMVEVGVVSFSEGRCLPVAEVEFVVVGCGLMGGNFLKFAGGFVVVVVVETVVGGSKLEVVAVVGIVWSCVNGELHSLWQLSRKSLEGKMSNVGGSLFGVVTRADSLMECFLGEVTGSIENVVVVKMLVGVVESMVLADSGVLLEVVKLVQLIV